MKIPALLLGFFFVTICASSMSLAADPNGMVHVPAFDLPLSGLQSEDTHTALKRQAVESEAASKLCPANYESSEKAIAYRLCAEKIFYPPALAKFHARYKVEIRPEKIEGVPIEIFTPGAGVAPENQHRLLINVHGGGFFLGGRWGGQIESIPIAAVGRIKVVSIDYRMAPEYHFPAATEDVVKVYKALLKDYRPTNIGIYGCSAGGVLTAEAAATFQKEGLPRPGAIGMFCGAAVSSYGGDSSRVGIALTGVVPGARQKNLYFNEADFKNPLAFPALDDAVMAQFPPSLLITGSRDQAMSAVVVTHTQLARLGVKADLYVWEGLGHAFFFDPDLPESREVYDVVTRFFQDHLAR